MAKDIIQKSFQPLYGLPCWLVHNDTQLNLTMNFGKPSLDVREPIATNSTSEVVTRMASCRNVTVRGERWLWIYCCFWRLSSENVELAKSSSSIGRIERAIKVLDGQKLVSVEVNPSTGATRFDFDLGCSLDCRRYERDTDDNLWLLYKPSGYVISVQGKGTFCHQRGTDVKKRFRPIKQESK